MDSRAAIVLPLLAMLAGVPAASGQDAGCRLQLSSSRLEPGEAIDAQLICTNTGRPETPEAHVPDGLRLEMLAATPSVFQRMSIINGRQSQEITYTFPVRLTALKEGTYQLGPIALKAEGRAWTVDPVSVVVEAREVASQPRGDQAIFAEIQVSPESVYVSQTVDAVLTVGMRQVVINQRTYPLDLLRDVLDLRSSQLSVFADGNYSQSRTRLADSSGQAHVYEIFRIRKEIRAEDVGEMLIGPVFLKGNYPTQLRRDLFGRLEIVGTPRRETARADAVAVEVKSPPLEGRPDSFTGAIGRYSFAAEAKPERVELGQPITLTMVISGAPLEGVAAPALTQQAELLSRFDFTGDELVGDIEGNRKTFRRAIFPRQAGPQTVPAIEWSYFDPDAERYVTLRSDPIPITVDEASTATTVQVPPGGEGAPAAPEPVELRVLTGGISPNYVDPDLLLVRVSLPSTTTMAAMVAAPPVVWLAALVLIGRQRRLAGDITYARRKRARQHAERMLSRSEDQLDTAGAALRSYIADRFALPRGESTPAELAEVLVESGVDEQTADEVRAFLESCDASRYSPDGATASAGRPGDRVREWMDRIEQAVRKSTGRTMRLSEPATQVAR